VGIKRAWKNADTLSVKVPMGLRIEGFADNPDRLAFLYGPIVLCAQVEPGKPFAAVAPARQEVLKALKPAGPPDTFTGSSETFRALGRAGGLTLEPFFAMHGGRRYQVYFDRFTQAQWNLKEADHAAELARQRELEARTVDFVAPDPERGERGHGLRGEGTTAGEFGGRQWRHATDGGWFSWDLKVLPDVPQQLQVTYWGGDEGNRIFDILVGEQKIATQRLERNKPDQFYDEIYPLPAPALQGKSRVTVKFQAHPGAWAGGVFGVRVLRAEAGR
jgi:hypothetical protein